MGEGTAIIWPKRLLADPGAGFICSRAVRRSCLRRQVVLTHCGFGRGYGVKLRLVRLKEGLINLCELEGRQGFVSQAVLGHGDPLCLLAEGKSCTRKSYRANRGASKHALCWFISLFNCKLSVWERRVVWCGHTSCHHGLKFGP